MSEIEEVHFKNRNGSGCTLTKIDDSTFRFVRSDVHYTRTSGAFIDYDGGPLIHKDTLIFEIVHRIPDSWIDLVISDYVIHEDNSLTLTVTKNLKRVRAYVNKCIKHERQSVKDNDPSSPTFEKKYSDAFTMYALGIAQRSLAYYTSIRKKLILIEKQRKEENVR